MGTAHSSSVFDRAVGIVLAQEGGFVEHPRDPGGATKYGITRQTLARARGRAVTVGEVRDLSEQEARQVYRRFFWDAMRAEELPAGLALVAFDFAVNSGPPRAVQILQEVLGVEADGHIGPRTLAAAAASDAQEIIRRLTRARLAFLSRLAAWPVFGRGWRRRVLAVEREALRLSASATTLSSEGLP